MPQKDAMPEEDVIYFGFVSSHPSLGTKVVKVIGLGFNTFLIVAELFSHSDRPPRANRTNVISHVVSTIQWSEASSAPEAEYWARTAVPGGFVRASRSSPRSSGPSTLVRGGDFPSSGS